MRVCALLTAIALSVGFAFGQTSSSDGSSQDELARIIGYSILRGGASDFLENLTDRIGGRITGTVECRETAELILNTLKNAGFDNAHFESYEINPGWTHGPATAEVIAPIHRDLIIGSYGWAPGTNGPIEVPVEDIGAMDGHSPLPERVRGAAVIVTLPSSMTSTLYVGTRMLLGRQLAKAGAAAMFIVSDKPDRMLYTSAFLIYPRGPLPIISIPNEDASLVRRLLQHGPVKIRLNVQNSFSNGPVPERNVVADLQGTDPGEMVLLTAHFDSWDPAQGANDNGGGVAAILEAARVLKLLKVQPKHTIRFVFFSGEEQSDLGSRAYVRQHKQELDKVRAVINTDSGIEAPLGLKLYGRKDLESATQKLLAPLASLGANQVFTDADFDSDEESFMVVGVPTFSLVVEPADYQVRHHTAVDTFERIDKRMLALDTAVLAAVGYEFANSDERPGKRLSPSEVKQLLRQTNLESLYELDYPGEKPY
ncbi:MAG TPA: M20/M25/M40 family metallo-hydrolase [Terriglobales bacterium]|nr:M20/M25/M40 family metallo-hydrolase [Terriglobales bacterium]